MSTLGRFRISAEPTDSHNVKNCGVVLILLLRYGLAVESRTSNPSVLASSVPGPVPSGFQLSEKQCFGGERNVDESHLWNDFKKGTILFIDVKLRI